MEQTAVWDHLVTIVEAQPWCTLITLGPGGLPHPRTVTRLNRLGARPVGTVAYLDFPTSLGSRKVPEIRADARVTLFFVDLETRDHATLYGQAGLLAAADLRRKYHREHGFEGAGPAPPTTIATNSWSRPQPRPREGWNAIRGPSPNRRLPAILSTT